MPPHFLNAFWLLSKGSAAKRRLLGRPHPIKPKPGLMGAPTRATLAQSGARFALTLLCAGLRQQGSCHFQRLTARVNSCPDTNLFLMQTHSLFKLIPGTN